MLASSDDVLLRIADAIHAGQLLRSTAYAAMMLVPILAVVYVLEARGGADRARYRTRHFVNDVVYTLFYRGGLYSVFVVAALTNVLEPRIEFLKLNLLGDASWPLKVVAYWVIGDFCLYWWHRLQHANRFMWTLHCVHHSQERLTLFTAYRRHPLETLMVDVVIFFGVTYVLLGIPTRSWLPLSVATTTLIALQHCELSWRYGPFYRLVVSPAFHSYHHSTDPRHYNRNFGAMFSIWDYLFGTAVRAEPRPTRYGIEGIHLAESIPHHLVDPIKMWFTRRSEPKQRERS